MTPQKTSWPFKPSFLFKMVGAFLILGLMGAGSLYYIKISVQKWCQQQNLDVSLKSWSLGLRGLTLKEIKVENKNPKGSFLYVSGQSISIQPRLFSFFQYYGQGGQFTLKCDTLEIKLTNGDVVTADKITSDITYEKNIYKITNFQLEPLRLDLGPNSTTLTDKNKPNVKGSHLIIYQLKGEGRYWVEESTLKLSLQAPSASLQMPRGKTYSIQAQGEMKFLSQDKEGIKENDPGIRGKITFIIHNFSNFLRHLYQARIISNVVKNLAEIMGRSLSSHELFTQQKEIFTEAVSLELSFQPNGVYIGPMKL